MEAEGRTVWDGVRNMQARKFMREMRLGDRCLFYHSAQECGRRRRGQSRARGISRSGRRKLSVVDVAHVEAWPLIVSLERNTLKTHKDGALQGMKLLQQPRLSVQPVSAEDFAFVQSLRAQKRAAARRSPSQAPTCCRQAPLPRL